jgi:hypothetical protein
LSAFMRSDYTSSNSMCAALNLGKNTTANSLVGLATLNQARTCRTASAIPVRVPYLGIRQSTHEKSDERAWLSCGDRNFHSSRFSRVRR